MNDTTPTANRRRALACVAAVALSACAGGGSPDSPVQAPAAVTTRSAVDAGHLVGTVRIGPTTYVADGALAGDGSLRLQLSLSDVDYNGTGSMQVVGSLSFTGSAGSGYAYVLQQACEMPRADPLCGAAPAGLLQMTARTSPSMRMQGELRFATEAWQIDLAYWGGIPAVFVGFTAAAVQGSYREVLGELAGDAGLVVSVDGGGRLSLQSVATGCIGSGALTSRPGTVTTILDAALIISNCHAHYAVLNGDYSGISVFEPPTPWDYSDYGMRLWVSTTPDRAAPAAITFHAQPGS